MPNMYKSVGYEAYQKVDFSWMAWKRIPAENTVARRVEYLTELRILLKKELARLNPKSIGFLEAREQSSCSKELYAFIVAHLSRGNEGRWTRLTW